MKRPRFTEDQILAVLREAEAGVKVRDLCQKYGMSDGTFYKWRAKYEDRSASLEKRMNKLENENRRLRSIVAELTLRNQALKRVVDKKW